MNIPTPQYTGRKMQPGAYRFNEQEGRFEFFLKYWVGPDGHEYKVFANREEVEKILQQLDRHYGHTGITVRIINKLLPEGIKRQIAGSFE